MSAKSDRALARTWGLVFICVVIAMALVAMWAPKNQASACYLWELGLMLLALDALGRSLNGRWYGAAIDARNRLSLSKLQMLAWTTVMVCSLLTMAAYRLHDPAVASADALVITLPPELLFAMGISAASFVATPALLSLKAAETPTQQAVDSTRAARGADVVEHQGKVDRRSSPAGASLTDLIRGDEVGNNLSLDISKLQQIAITLLLLGIYVGAVYRDLGLPPVKLTSLPPLKDSLVQLMGISHASYLIYKAAPKTSTGDAPVNETVQDGPPGAIGSIAAHGSPDRET